MIIVEGVDGSGKSTLVDELVFRLGLTKGQRSIKDRDRIRETTVEDSYRAVIESVSGRALKVWDRMWFSEMIYTPIIRNEEPQFTRMQYNFLTRIAVATSVPIIICAPSREIVHQNVEKDHQMDGVVEHIDDLYDAYSSLYRVLVGMEATVYHYDYTQRGSLPNIAEECRLYARRREEMFPVYDTRGAIPWT